VYDDDYVIAYRFSRARLKKTARNRRARDTRYSL